MNKSESDFTWLSVASIRLDAINRTYNDPLILGHHLSFKQMFHKDP